MPPTQFVFEAIGTKWQVDIFDELAADAQAELRLQILKRIEIFAQTYSRFQPNSLVMEMSVKAGTYTLPRDAEPLISIYQDLYQITNGAFTPLIGQVLVQAGYDANYSLQQTEQLTSPKKWEEVLDYKFPTLTLKEPILLDFGAAGKGYLVDLVDQLFKQKGLTSYCIDGGGDIFYRNPINHVLQVGLEHPENPDQVIGVAIILNQSICGSSGNRRKWGSFHHLINPYTLTSPNHIIATWTIADTALIADAMATCLYFVTPDKLLQKYKFEYLMLNADYTVEKSPHFPAELYYQQPPVEAAPPAA